MRLALGDWFEGFLSEFCGTMQVRESQIGFREEAADLEVRFDPSHLHQVVWNLCDNAMKYGEARDGISVEISIGRLSPSSRPYLEVANHGTAIEPEFVDRIFEPFFTGRKGGTGLGLFIARELCQLNRRDHVPAMMPRRRRQHISELYSATRSAGRSKEYEAQGRNVRANTNCLSFLLPFEIRRPEYHPVPGTIDPRRDR